MAIRWQRELPHWIILWAMLALAAFTWDAAPDRIPVHWGLSGEADRYSDKAEGLLTLPIIALVTYLGLLLVPQLLKATEAQLGGIYAWLRLAILVMLAGLYAAIVLALQGVPLDIGRIGPALVGALLFTIGAVMGRMRPNMIMGVRTPWTLSSQAAWDASHRVGGWIFMAVGGLLVLGGLTGIAWVLLAAIAALLVGMIALVVYGWRIARSDPQRLPAGQTLLTHSPAAAVTAGRQLSPGRTRPKSSKQRRRGRR
jgi:uncharacterized membrane protein